MIHTDTITENSIVTPSPRYLASIQKPDLKWARGRVTLIEHLGGKEYVSCTWDFPGLPETMPIENVVDAKTMSRTP